MPPPQIKVVNMPNVKIILVSQTYNNNISQIC